MAEARDTIAALASGAGRAGVAVVRLSGPKAGPALKALTERALPKPRQAARRRFADPATGAPLDEGLALWFPAPASFTGEDVAEFHIHGGPALIAALLDVLTRLDGVRLAAPGEFTRRAFAHGKLDLTQAEGLADLVEAETEGQRKQALAQMQGALGALYEDWRARLIEAMALLEAAIDFPDEDLPADLAARVFPRLSALFDALGEHLADAHRGERVRDGYRIAIIGAPNAGKSSLLNALARREAAIVSDIPGTTRDVVEVRLVLAGFPVWIADTAGLREAADAIEAEGVRRALARAEEADLRILAVESGTDGRQMAAQLLKNGDVWLYTKSDLRWGPSRDLSGYTRRLRYDRDFVERLAAEPIRKPSPISFSVFDPIDVANLLDLLAAKVAIALEGREAPALTRARHRGLVGQAHAALGRARAALEQGPELAAEELRAAADALGKLTGRIDVEDLLDDIFSKFCIGK